MLTKIKIDTNVLIQTSNHISKKLDQSIKYENTKLNKSLDIIYLFRYIYIFGLRQSSDLFLLGRTWARPYSGRIRNIK